MMQHPITIEEMSRKLRPILGEKMDQLFMNYNMAEELEKKKQIANIIYALYIKYISHAVLKDQILLEPPTKEMVKGEYPIGIISYANNDLYSFNMREHDWQRHMCITGMSGSGKTTLAYQLIRNFIVKNKPFLIMDWKKSFRPLMLIDQDILLFTVGNETISNGFKVNINRPPKGVPPKEWISILTDVILESFTASHGTAKILAETLDQAFKDFKVYQGSENYPTWRQIYDRLLEKENESRMNRRETEWLTTAVRIAHMLTFGDYGKCLCTKGTEEMTVEEIMDKRVVFELYSLNTVQKKFFCEYLLTYIYKMKKNLNMTADEFEHAIIVDEAHNIFLRERPSFMRETVTDMIYREMREYGESLICLDQHISKLSETVVGNSACIVAFQQILPQDVEVISTLTQLRDKRNYFSMLDVGQAVVRLAERYNDPFMIKVPYIPLKKENVENDYVIQRMKAYIRTCLLKKAINNSTEEKKINEEMEGLRKIYFKSGVNTTASELKRIHIDEAPKTFHEVVVDNLTGEENAFLELVKSQELSVSQAYAKLGLSARKGNALKDSLIKKQLIQVKEEKNEKGWKKLLMPAVAASVTA
ncbi:ATP-binding protein [Candidatus Woesearchaeota archaeon]|nr:ATP-binding protein [Candidatus Woesearchaeota archaeon]